MTTANAEKGSPEKDLSGSLSSPACLFVPSIFPMNVPVAPNEGVWLSLEALELNYHIN